MTPALRRGRRLASIPLGVALLAALVFAAQAPAAPDDGFLGAKTDTAASTMCPAGSAVVGLFGRVGTFNPGEYAASIRVSCEGGATAGESIGDGGFTEEQTACPDGHYAVGIEGNEGDFIDRIALRCRPSILGAVEATAGYPSGGFGGSLDGPYDCGSNEMLVGLDGSVSDLNMLSTARHV
ncbi:MAG TPA: hypothetical protein VHH14_07020, partial [Solirubrobacterales bacterium]|nr:hypothetical protein [Solirubrobacterales bacterium]